MKTEIIRFLENPSALEKLYRSNKTSFKQSFQHIYPEFKGHSIADCWYERLNFEGNDTPSVYKKELAIVVVMSLLAGLIAKIPAFFSIDENFFYPRNIGFIVIPLLAGYFAWKNKLPRNKIALGAIVMFIGLIFINLHPGQNRSNTLTLSCIHMVLCLWSVFGLMFVGKFNAVDKRLDFLRYNGDLVVITGLILIAGGLMSAITIGLFQLIGLNIENYYFQYVVIFGLSAAPIVGTFLTQTNPQLVGRISPVIARLFSPLVVIMLSVYLIAIMYAGRSPYYNRDFLIIFNVLLIGVLLLIFFSVAESARSATSKFQVWILLMLAVLTLLVNGIALSAIIFRISEWGITPNRADVLGANVLILIHLFLVAIRLLKVVSAKEKLANVAHAIVSYLPVYMVWATVVTFVFPFLFDFS